MGRISAVTLFLSIVAWGQPVRPWNVRGIGPSANRPTCVNGDVWNCVGTGCTTGKNVHTCVSGSWVEQGVTPGAGITSLNALVGDTQTFTNDTNVTIASAGSAHVITWVGQLAASRGGTGINSSGSTGVPRVSGGTWTTDAGISHLAASSSANLAGVLSDESGTGVVAFNVSPSITTPSITGAITFQDDVRQTFNPGATTAGLNVGSHTADPSGGANGDVAYNSTTNKFRCYENGAWTNCIGAGGGSGTVNAGAIGCLTFYPATGTTVDDARNSGACAVLFDSVENTVTFNNTSGVGTLRIDGDDGSITVLGSSPFSITGLQQSSDPAAPAGAGEVVLYFLSGRPKFRANGGSATDIATGDSAGAATLAPTEAYAVGWNADTGPPQKDAVYDKVETLPNTGSCTNQVVTALNAAAAPTCASVGTAMVSNDAITRDKVSAVLRTRTATFLLGAENGSALGDGDDQPSFWINRLGSGVTITEVHCECDAGTPTVNIQRDDGTPADVLSSNLTCSTSGATGTIDTNEDNVADTQKLDFSMRTAGGVAKRVLLTVKYTLD